ncbi:hypothetical protein cypCar_00008733 [Cyprinus carpio]|nr:hypothetical protein cypCar_00008733 [Cyprinus carpio]
MSQMAGCSEECKCAQENSLSCDLQKGTCTCKPGYHGNRCQEEYDKGYYGIGYCKRCTALMVSCLIPKRESARRCAQQDTMERNASWVVTGRFGRAYAELCECDERPCDPATGLCLCPPGKTGKHCEKGTIAVAFLKCSRPSVQVGEQAGTPVP